MVNPGRVEQFFHRFPLLAQTAKTLQEAGIPWFIGGSGCLFLLGNERLPDDVDIFLRDEDHDRVDALFAVVSAPYTSPLERVRNSRPWNEHSIQLTSHLDIMADGKTYPVRVTDAVVSHATEWTHDGVAFRLLPPEDVLLIKGLLQRGPDVGKHDVEDIRAFKAVYPTIDQPYLRSRIVALHAEDRLISIL